jgi:hypothetical protein
MALALKADHFRNGSDSTVLSASRLSRLHAIDARGRTLQHDRGRRGGGPRWCQNRGLRPTRAGVDKRDPRPRQRQAETPRQKLRYSCRRGKSAAGTRPVARARPRLTFRAFAGRSGRPAGSVAAAKVTHASRSCHLFENYRRSYCKVSAMISATSLPIAFKPCCDHSCHNMHPTGGLGLYRVARTWTQLRRQRTVVEGAALADGFGAGSQPVEDSQGARVSGG